MNLNKIRDLSDEELIKYLRNLGNRSVEDCSLCGEKTNKIVKIENIDTQQTKQLCGLCDGCYEKLLDFLNTLDICWR